jgi:carbonic anhydrase
VVASVEYAVGMLAVPLIVVLGHDGCGAVAAATSVVDGDSAPPGSIRKIAEQIAPHVSRARSSGAANATEIGGQHTLFTAQTLRRRSAIVWDAIDLGELVLVPAQYTLSDGTVDEVRPLVRSFPPRPDAALAVAAYQS